MLEGATHLFPYNHPRSPARFSAFEQPLVDANGWTVSQEILIRPTGYAKDAEAYYRGIAELTIDDRLAREMDSLRAAIAVSRRKEVGLQARSINVSMPMLISQQGQDALLTALKYRWPDRGLLMIELLEYDEAPLEQLSIAVDRLAGAGAGISLDDFGQGHGCLSVLANLPVVNQIKFDKSVVHGRRGHVVLPAFVRASHDIGATVVAEFVDSEECRQRMFGYGVDLCQGFHVGTPAHICEMGV